MILKKNTTYGVLLFILLLILSGCSKDNDIFEEIGYYKEKFSIVLGNNTKDSYNRVYSIYVNKFSDTPSIWGKMKEYAKDKMHSAGGSTIVYFFNNKKHTTQLSYSGDIIPQWDQPYCVAKYSGGSLEKWPFNNEPINVSTTKKFFS